VRDGKKKIRSKDYRSQWGGRMAKCGKLDWPIWNERRCWSESGLNLHTLFSNSHQVTALIHKYNSDRTVLFIVPCLQKTFPPSLIYFLLVPILTFYKMMCNRDKSLICSCSYGSWDASEALARKWLNILRLISWLFVSSLNHIKHKLPSWNCITVLASQVRAVKNEHFPNPLMINNDFCLHHWYVFYNIIREV
jgi:hypothetical protein